MPCWDTDQNRVHPHQQWRSSSSMTSQPPVAAQIRRGVVYQAGCCLSPRFLCGTPRSVLENELYSEDELCIHVLPASRVEAVLHQGAAERLLVWLDEAALDLGKGSIQLSFRVGQLVRQCQVPIKPVKVQMVQRRQQQAAAQPPAAAATGAAGSTAGAAAGEVVCRIPVGATPFSVVSRLVTGLAPQLTALLAEVEAQPGFVSSMDGVDPLTHLQQHHLLVSSTDQGLTMSTLDDDGSTIRQGLIRINMAQGCLDLYMYPPNGSSANSERRQIQTLRSALAIFDKAAARQSAGPQAMPLSPEPQTGAFTGDGEIAAAVGLIRQPAAGAQEAGLKRLLDAADTGALDWTGGWVNQGCVEALVDLAAATSGPDRQEAGSLEQLLCSAAEALLIGTPVGSSAPERAVLAFQRHLAKDQHPSLMLYRLLLALLDVPVVCQAAMAAGLSEQLTASFRTLCAPAHAKHVPRRRASSMDTAMTESFHHHWSPAPSSPQRSKLGPRSPTTPGSPSLPLASRASDFAGFNAGSPKAPFARSRSVNRTSSLKYSATAEEDIMELLEDGISLMPTSMPRPPTSSMAPRPSPLNIPRLTLPLAHSPSLTAGGLTRSTRRSLQTERTMGLTPSGSQRFPTPPDSFREVEQSERLSAAAELAALGGALGESLIAADLGALIAHRRVADMRRISISSQASIEGRLDKQKSLEGHRILLTSRSACSGLSQPSTARDYDIPPDSAGRGTHGLSRVGSVRSMASLAAPNDLRHEPVELQVKCLILEALMAVTPVIRDAGPLGTACAGPSSSLGPGLGSPDGAEAASHSPLGSGRKRSETAPPASPAVSPFAAFSGLLSPAIPHRPPSAATVREDGAELLTEELLRIGVHALEGSSPEDSSRASGGSANGQKQLRQLCLTLLHTWAAPTADADTLLSLTPVLTANTASYLSNSAGSVSGSHARSKAANGTNSSNGAESPSTPAQRRLAAPANTPKPAAERHVAVREVARHMAAALNSNFSVRQTTPAVLRELSGCLALLEQYIAASPVPSLPGLVLATCGESLQGIRMLLHIGGAVSSWPEETMDLIGALLGLYTTLQSNCRQPATGQQLLSLLVEDRDFVTMTSDFAKHVLATPTLHPTPHGPHTGASAAQTGTIGSPGTASSSPVPISPFANLTLPLNGDSPRDNHRHQLVTLRFYAALAGLVGRQPSVEALQQPDAGRQAPASKDPGNDTLLPGPPGDLGQRVNGSGPHAGTWTAADKALKRKAALRHFHFLVDPSRGAAVRLLEQKPAAARDKEGCVHTEVLHMLRAVFSVPGNPFLDVKRISDHYIHIHFLHFAKLYHTQGRREAPTPPLCLAHLGVLRAIAGCKGADVRRRFYQLRIMDFLVRELSLECEAAQWASLPAGMGGSGPLSRSPSSALHTPSGLGPPVNEPLSPYTPSFAKPPAAKLALPGQLLTSRSRAQSGDDLSARSGKSGSGSAKSGGSSRRSRVPPLTLSRSASLADATAEAANEPEYRDGTGTVRTSDGGAGSSSARAREAERLQIELRISSSQAASTSSPAAPALSARTSSSGTAGSATQPAPAGLPQLAELKISSLTRNNSMEGQPGSARKPPMAPKTSTSGRAAPNASSAPATTASGTTAVPAAVAAATTQLQSSTHAGHDPPTSAAAGTTVAAFAPFARPPIPKLSLASHSLKDGGANPLQINLTAASGMSTAAGSIPPLIPPLPPVKSLESQRSGRLLLPKLNQAVSTLTLALPGAGSLSNQSPQSTVQSCTAAATAGSAGSRVERSSGSSSDCESEEAAAPASLVAPPGFVFSGDLDEDCEALEALEAEQEAAGMSSDDEGSDSGSDASEDSPRLNDSANGTKWSSPPRRAVPCLRLGAARKDSGLSPGPFIKAQAGALDTTPSKVAELVAKFEAASSPMADSPAVKLTPFKAPGSPVADSPGRKIAAYMPAGSPLAPALPERAAPATAGKGPAFIPRLNLSASLHSNMEQRLQTAEASVAAEAVSKDSAKPNLTLLEGFAMDKGRMQAALMARQPSRVVESASEVLAEGGLPPRLSCHEERAQRPLYRNTELHLLVLETVLEVVLTREGELDPVYCCQLPLERRMQNVLYLLQQHLNHAANAALIAPLLTRAVAIGPAAERLLRLLCRGLFQSHLYSARSRLARGAYAQVFRCPLPTQAGGPDHVALKVVDLPTSLHDPCYQVDMFSEVAILERFRGQASICQLYDYGIDADSFVLVLRCYRCSLKEWRTRQPPGPGPQLRLYLALFAQVLAAVQVLGLANVVHFDLKCDNILLEALPGCSEEDFWSPPSADALPFRVVLADFGESRMFTSADNSVTARNRGTECVKSPEMLLVANADKKGRDTYDRRKKEGAGAASDVWSVGCLLFELITGDFLFYDPDWIRFFMRLTQPGQVLLAPERAAAVAQLPGVPELLDCILVRDPRRRPPLAEVAHRVQNLLAGTRIRLPPYLRPQAPAPDHLDAAHSALSPLQRFGQNGLVATASPDAPYCTAEYYLSVLTPVSDRLLLGSLAGLQPPAALAEAGVGHVLLLCARSELRGESGGGEQGQAAAAALCSWAVADSSLNTALANCAAAEASCRLVPLANLPDIEPAEGPSDSLDLVRILPSLLQHMSSVTGPAAASAGSLSRSPRGRRVLIAAAPGYEGEAAVVAMAQLMVKSNLSAYEALLLVSQRQIALQLKQHNLRQLSAWAATRDALAKRTAGRPCFRCGCGAFRAYALRPLEHDSEGDNPRAFPAAPTPAASSSGRSGDAITDCGKLAQDWAHRLKYVTDKVWWARTTQDALEMDPTSPCEEVPSAPPAATSRQRSSFSLTSRAPLASWTLYQCSACRCVTHGVAAQSGSPAQASRRPLHIIANWMAPGSL